MPKISVGVPVYNGENYLEEAVNSVLAQTFPDFEVIISDNASDDRTEEICRGFEARDSRIRYIRR
ncbi:MAG: glycosyltransferase family 2 protein, partial [Rhodothermales bacterium]|nr:glycosyltransferase family 2 protein [Rhodothermales bacterium]